jgi:AraC family transcriptional regulator of arabinose operon
MKKYADISCYGMSQFVRCFKNTTGKTPTKYRIDSKIAKAKEMLLSSSLPMNQIAALCGYSDPLYFSRIFKKKVGVPPKEYRKMHGKD